MITIALISETHQSSGGWGPSARDLDELVQLGREALGDARVANGQVARDAGAQPQRGAVRADGHLVAAT